MENVGSFDRTLQKTYEWIDDVAERLPGSDRQKAYLAIRAVMHTLRDRLTNEEAADLGAQLPMLARGFYYEGWRPAEQPERYDDSKEFLRRVAGEVPGAEIGEAEAEAMTRAVLASLEHRVTAGETKDVKSQLPGGLRELWPL